MKIIRHGAIGREKPGLLDVNGILRDLSRHMTDWTGAALGRAALDRILSIDPETLPEIPSDTRLGCPIARVRNVICVGLNYVKHAAETNNPLPAEPLLFNKHTASIAGCRDPIIKPPGSTALDWEVELGVVIGKSAWHVSEADAIEHVAGYVLANDVSERNWQMNRSGQWTKGKSYPGWAPLGPWLVTADEITDPHSIALWLDVNGTRRQDGNTDDMHFRVPRIVAAASELMALLPGDVILTGTPSGVGMGSKPPTFLMAGDEIEIGGSFLGRQKSRVIDFEPAIAADILSRLEET